jgi:NADH:ubiquinone oxidoreductase subunit 6 (subunit J)
MQCDLTMFVVVGTLYLLTFIFITILIISNNSLYSVFSLILIVLSLVTLLFFLEFEFVAYILIIIYIGAVSILFLFFIMMVNTNIFFKSYFFSIKHFFYLTLGLKICHLFYLSLYQLFYINILTSTTYTNLWILNFISYKKQDIFLFGDFLYTNFWYYTFFISLLLLIGMVGSISLCLVKK